MKTIIYISPLKLQKIMRSLYDSLCNTNQNHSGKTNSTVAAEIKIVHPYNKLLQHSSKIGNAHEIR